MTNLSTQNKTRVIWAYPEDTQTKRDGKDIDSSEHVELIGLYLAKGDTRPEWEDPQIANGC